MLEALELIPTVTRKMVDYIDSEFDDLQSITKMNVEEFREYVLSGGNYTLGGRIKKSLLDKIFDRIFNILNYFRRTSQAEKLMSKRGAQFFKDENGKRFVVGFGQSAVQKSDQRQSNFINIGRRKARLQAIENIKNLLAEDLVGKEIDENIEKITEFQDGEQSLYTESNYSELIQSKKSSIKMNTMNLSDWQGTHPVSNSFVVGTIVILTESNNLNFADDTQADSKKTKKSEYKVSSDIEGEEL